MRKRSSEVTRAKLSRRELLGRMAGGAATLVVSQSLIAYGADGVTAAQDEDDDAAAVGCVLTAALTEGPYFVDERLERSDIRTDPESGDVSDGVPLDLTFNVLRVASGACTPLTGAFLDVWHCDAAGVYSDVAGAGSGRRFLRGYQITDADGVARFTTIYPGWYQGRAVHIHFKLRLIAGATSTYEFTSQFFFDDSLTDAVYELSPYDTRGERDTRNATDGIHKSLSASEMAALTLQAAASGNGYSGTIDLGVVVG